ncbi:MAG: hypothetical protein QMB72_05550 [Brachymonas denitrificans]|uniref:hypothetical protein n=1 Tax=Brachymonas denitrificans TaxID=28220 RepID=UPI001BD1A572|nr:hypothetical protein [Brachymonas denitrificans]
MVFLYMAPEKKNSAGWSKAVAEGGILLPWRMLEEHKHACVRYRPQKCLLGAGI